jgi:predicted RNase H-like nuclease
VELFVLERTIKYKKGRVAEKRNGIRDVQSKISQFSESEPRLISTPIFREFLCTDLEALSGQSLKDYEDKIDSIICAYLAFYYWAWGATRTAVFGEVETGYIVNPTRALSTIG